MTCLEQEVRRERIASLKDLLRSDCLLDPPPPPPILAGAALLVAFSIYLDLRRKRRRVNPRSNGKQIQMNRLEKQQNVM